MAAEKVIQSVYEDVLKRNAGEAEFQQAVKEVLDSLGPVLDKHPESIKPIIRRWLGHAPRYGEV